MVLVEVEGLGKRYGDRWAVRGVRLSVDRGEVVGVVGPNGAGKTTVLKILAGLLEPTEGTARIAGFDAGDARQRERTGYLPEESAVYDDLDPRGYLRFFASLYGVPREEADRRIDRALVRLRFDPADRRRLGDLSKGNRRKVALARALVHEPDLLILDEPGSGLDPLVSATVLDVVRELRTEGRGIVFSAHNLWHVERICDRVLLLHGGAVLAQGTVAEIRAALRGTEYVVRLSVQVEGALPVEGGFESVAPDFERVKEIETLAAAAGGRVLDVRARDLPLEDVFLRAAR